MSNNLSIKIDSLIKNKSFYEIATNILQLRKSLGSFKDYNDCAIIKHIIENEKYKTQEACVLINHFLRTYFYFFEQEFSSRMLSEGENSFKFDAFNPEDGSKYSRDTLAKRFFTEKVVEKVDFGFDAIILQKYKINLKNFELYEEKLNQVRMILNATPKNVILEYEDNEFLLGENETFENIQIIKFVGKIFFSE